MEPLKDGDQIKFEDGPGNWVNGTILQINRTRVEIETAFGSILWRDLENIVLVSRRVR